MIFPNQIRQLKSLHQKKFRRKEKKILLEGYRLIEQAISANAQIEKIWMSKKSSESLLGRVLAKKINNHNIKLSIISNKIIQQISDSLNDQGIIALVPFPCYQHYKNPPKKSIFLDGIADPGNMGTILRTAAWFGIKSIFRSPTCVDPFNSKVVRAAMGSHFSFSHFEEIGEERILSDLNDNGIEILGTALEGIPLNSIDPSSLQRWCLVLGSEAHGITSQTRNYITTMVTIPGSNNMESLNVSVAGGILLHTLSSLT